MKNKMWRSLSLMRGCWKTLFLFEILYRLFSAYLFFPACKWLFNSCLHLTGLHYLTGENLGRFLTNPLMLVCCAVILLLFALVAMLEISCLISCLHAAYLRDTLGIFQLIIEGGRDALRFLRPRNYPLLLITAFMIPITQLPTRTSPLRLIQLPWQSLADYALHFPYLLGTIAYLAGIASFFLLFICVYQRYVLEDVPATAAITSAFRAEKGRRVRSLFQIAIWMLLCCGLIFGAASLISNALRLLIRFFIQDLNTVYHVMLPFSTILGFIKSSTPAIACYAYISVLYYTSKQASSEAIPGQVIPYRANARRFNAIIFYVVAALCILSLVMYDTVLRPLLVRYDALDWISGRPTLVIAHRGYFEETDENTLTAFQAAINLGVDYVELDVQQTADGVVIVAHDNSFWRVFGDRRNVWEMTYDEVRSLTSKRSGEHPPTLYEVLTLSDPNANFLIELKNNGHNPNLAQAVYDVLNECQCFERCIIQSASYRMLTEFKALSPDTRCGYILSFALGSYTTLNAADFFSIDYNFTSEDIINAIHHTGKDVFVWTVNSEKLMNEYLSLGADGIITDNAPLAKTLLLDSDGTALDELISAPLEEALNPSAETEDSPDLSDESAGELIPPIGQGS